MEKLERILKEINENLYSVLAIEKTDDQERIKRAYKKMIKKYHPDKNKDKNTVEVFEKIKKAYEILKNFETKALYDSYIDRKKEKENKITGERKKFADELKRREDNSKNAEAFKNHSQKNFNNSDDNFTSRIKTNDEKLNYSGIKIKWNPNAGMVISKDTIKSYFKEYGTIEDIFMINNSAGLLNNKAYVLFKFEKDAFYSVNDYANINLRKLFKIKKFKIDAEKAKDSKIFGNVNNSDKKDNTDPYGLNTNNLEEMEKMIMEKIKNKFKQ